MTPLVNESVVHTALCVFTHCCGFAGKLEERDEQVYAKACEVLITYFSVAVEANEVNKK